MNSSSPNIAKAFSLAIRGACFPAGRNSAFSPHPSNGLRVNMLRCAGTSPYKRCYHRNEILHGLCSPENTHETASLRACLVWQVCYHSSLALLRFGFFFFRLAAQHAVGSACRRPYETILRNAFAVFCLRKFPLRTGQPSCYVDSAFRYLSNRDVPGARSSRFTFSLLDIT